MTVAGAVTDQRPSRGSFADAYLPFGRWGETCSDGVVAAAMIARLVHRAEVLTLCGDSYRTRARRELPVEDRPQRG